MRILITGATGFIGSHLTRLLVTDGCHVTAITRPGSDRVRIAEIADRMRIVSCRLENSELLTRSVREADPEICLHLAWYAAPGGHCLSAIENLECLEGSLALLRALGETNCRRLVLAGTSVEYDTDLGYLSERSAIRPRSLYGACKQAMFLAAEQYGKQTGIAVAGARIFSVFGPWEDERRLVPLVIRSLLRGQVCPLTSGEQIRDYLHVRDVAGALWAIARSDLVGPVNVGSGTPVAVAHVARTIGDLMGRGHLLQLGARPFPSHEPSFLCANTELLRSRTGWGAQYSLETGLRETVEWWRVVGT